MTNNIIDNNISSLQEKQFAEVVELIIQHKCRASVAVNNETLFTAWSVGKYVSAKLKTKNGEVRSFLNYRNIFVQNVQM